jgi:hypothetical protein
MDLLNWLIIYWSDENITNNLKNHIDTNKTKIYFRFFLFLVKFDVKILTLFKRA